MGITEFFFFMYTNRNRLTSVNKILANSQVIHDHPQLNFPSRNYLNLPPINQFFSSFHIPTHICTYLVSNLNIPCFLTWAMSSNILDDDIRLSGPDERLELEEERRNPPSSLCPPCTTSLAAVVHFNVDCFLVIFLGLVGVEETGPEALESVLLSEVLVEIQSSDVMELVRLMGVSTVLGVQFTGTAGEAEVNDGSAVVKGASTWVTSLLGESFTEQEDNLSTREQESSAAWDEKVDSDGSSCPSSKATAVELRMWVGGESGVSLWLVFLST